MRILYDAAIYQEQTAGGINRYFDNLIGRLPPSFTPTIVTTLSGENSFPKHAQLQFIRFKRFKPRRVSLKLERAYFSRAIDSRKYDLAHPTYYTLLSQREIDDYQCPVVITVWDMIHELFPALDPSGRVIEAKRRAVAAATAILCISENTKKDLLATYKVPDSKVIVTHLAGSLDATMAHGKDQVPKRPYLLYVGSRAGYKNFDSLLSAFAKVAVSASDSALCVVGPPFTKIEEQKLIDMGLKDRVENYGQVSDSQLAKLYRCSRAFVYPSLYEGFGIPPLEAMACETVVVAANTSSLPEVIGDAGLLFDPNEVGELVSILEAVMREEIDRDSIIARGRDRSRQFSWDKTVNRTLDVYRAVAR